MNKLKYVQNMQSSLGGRGRLLVLLGSVLLSGVKQSRRGHICRVYTLSLLCISSPFNDGKSGRGWTPSCLSSCTHARTHARKYAYVHVHTESPDVCFFEVVSTQKNLTIFCSLCLCPALPSPSLESYSRMAEITSPSSNQGGRERWLSDPH